MRILKNQVVLAYKNADTLLLSQRNHLYEYCYSKDQLTRVYSFAPNLKSRLASLSPKIRRLFRSDIRYGFVTTDNRILLANSGQLYWMNGIDYQLISTIPLPRGSRPLNVTEINGLDHFTNGIYFGEYFSNPDRNSCHIYRITEDGLTVVHTFPEGSINHVHNLVVDVHRNCVWVLVGDFEHSAAIYRATADFSRVELIIGGSQTYRSCVAFPTESGLIYATDSQFQENQILLLAEANDKWSTTALYPLNGPCIFGSRSAGELFFSTSVEAINSGNFLQKLLRTKRGPGILKNHSEIVRGSLKGGFHTAYYSKKDRLPFVAFQFGNVLFPSGDNQTGYLAYTNVGLSEYDLSTQIIKL